MKTKFVISSLLISTVLAFSSCNLFQPEEEEETDAATLFVLAYIAAENAKPDCEKNSTGTVYFENRHGTTTYDIIWDGSKLTTVTPGNRSDTYTFASGQHTLLFRVTNTTTAACTQSTPNLATCSSVFFYCPA